MPGIRTDDIVFIRALAKENLNMSRAAKSTGLDPCNFYDMVKLLKMIEGR